MKADNMAKERMNEVKSCLMLLGHSVASISRLSGTNRPHNAYHFNLTIDPTAFFQFSSVMRIHTTVFGVIKRATLTPDQKRFVIAAWCRWLKWACKKSELRQTCPRFKKLNAARRKTIELAIRDTKRL